MITVYSFTKMLQASLGRTEQERRLLARAYDVPLKHILKTVQQTDQAGIDYIVGLPEGPRGVDVKWRSAGAARYWRSPKVEELAVEVHGPLVSGRTAAEDYYAYFQDTGRGYILPVPELMLATCSHLFQWRADYGERNTLTGNARGGSSATPVVYVPMPVITAAIRTVTRSDG